MGKEDGFIAAAVGRYLEMEKKSCDPRRQKRAERATQANKDHGIGGWDWRRGNKIVVLKRSGEPSPSYPEVST